jgi:hypothetical protein
LSNENKLYTIRQIAEDLAHVDKRVLSVLKDHEARLQDLELALVEVAKRVADLELRVGSAVTDKVAEGTFRQVKDLEEP